MVRGENPTPGSSSYSCHHALTLLFPHTHGPGHTVRSHTITLSIQREAYTCLSSTTLPFPTAQSCPSSQSTMQSVYPPSPWLSQSFMPMYYPASLCSFTPTTYYPLLPIHHSSHLLSIHPSFPDSAIYLSIHQPIYSPTHVPIVAIHL